MKRKWRKKRLWKRGLAIFMAGMVLTGELAMPVYAAEANGGDLPTVVSESTETTGDLEQTEALKDIVTLNNGSLQSLSSSIAMVGRKRVLYLNLDLTDVGTRTLTEATLTVTAPSKAVTTLITARDITGLVQVSGCKYSGTMEGATYYGDGTIPTILNADVIGSSLPTTFEGWDAVSKESAPIAFEQESFIKGTTTVDMTTYLKSCLAAGKTTVTLVLYGFDAANFSDGTNAVEITSATLTLKATSASEEKLNQQLAEAQLAKVEAYLTTNYGESLNTIIESIALPAQSDMGIDATYQLTWEKQEASSEGQVVYRTTISYGNANASKDFTFKLVESLQFAPSAIIRVKLYSDSAGTTAQTPAASDGTSGWYLRSDYVTFLNFDLSKFKGLAEEKYLDSAVFSVVGKQNAGQGASNTLSVICLEEALGDSIQVPEVLLSSGERAGLTADNLSSIAGTTILEDKTFSQLNTVTNTLDLTESIRAAIEAGKERITFLLKSDSGQATGGDLQSATAEMTLTVLGYDELLGAQLTKVEEYLKTTYGESLSTIKDNITPPTQDKIGIAEGYSLTWEKQESPSEGQIVYRATISDETTSVSKDFTFTVIKELEFAPSSIIRVKIYSDNAGTTAQTPAASDGTSALYLRSDYVTFLNFDLSELMGLETEKYLNSAVFSIVGNRDSGGAANTLSVICLEEALGDSVKVPEVLLRSGESTSLTADNLTDIAGTTILTEQTVSQLNTVKSTLDLTDSIRAAIRAGEERISFLLVSNAGSATGCDLNPSTAKMKADLAEYTDELKCAVAMADLQEKYTDFYCSADVELPLNDINGSAITWKSGNAEAITDDGKVTVVENEIQEVIMHITVSSGEVSQEEDVTFYVCDAATGEVYKALAALKKRMDYLNEQEITKDIELITALTGYDVEISWESDKTDYVTEAGKVTLPGIGEEDQNVTLTARIQSIVKEEVAVDYELKVIVPAKEDTDGAVAQAKEYLERLRLSYDGAVVVKDYYLPSEMDATNTTTTVVEWSLKELSDYYEIGAKDENGYPVTVTPPDEAGSVVLHCKVMTTGTTNTEYTAIEEADFTVYIAAGQEESPYGVKTMARIIKYAGSVYEQISANPVVVSATRTDGENNDIYDLQNDYDLQLSCDINGLIDNEKFGFLYYPSGYNGDEITEYSRITIAADTSGNTPGAVDAEKATAFKVAIDEAYAILGDYSSATTTQCTEATKKIVQAGIEMFASAQIDNTDAVTAVLSGEDGQLSRENQLVFSEIRRNLVSAVWEAKATLYQDAELYLLSDKRALAEQIEYSENALSGTYTYPQNNYREFRTRRDDEILEYCYSHQVRFRNYDSTMYGLIPMLTYYKQQSMLSGSFYEMQIPVSEALAVNEQGGATSSQPAAELTVSVDTNGYKRFGLLRFDLSSLQGDVQHASLKLTSNKSDSNINQIYLETLDNWTGSTAYSALVKEHGMEENGGVATGANTYLADFSPNGKGNDILISITDAVVGEQAGDGVISLRIQAKGVSTYPNGYVGTKNTTYTINEWPMLKVTVGIIDEEMFASNKENILDTKKQFLDEITTSDIGSYGSYNYANATVGSYPKDLYDSAMTAYENVESAVGFYATTEALVKLCDAVRILQDNLILATDVNPNSSMLFSEQELVDLRTKIASSEKLTEKYNEIKALSDEASLDDLKVLREAIFSNDTKAIDGLGVLNFTGIGSGANAKTINTSAMNTVNGGNAGNVAYAEFVVRLSGNQDYMGNGIENGYFAYVDDFNLTDANNNVVALPNPEFDKNADKWRYVGVDASYETSGEVALTGSNGNWTKTYSSGEETGCLYLENTDASSNGAWVSDRFELAPGSYSFTCNLKQHVVFKGEGITVVLRYYDKDGNYIGYSDNQCNNFKSGGSYGAWSLRFQADALVYAVTGDATYAEKCIQDLIIGANDFAQGSEHWMYDSTRPYGIDAYGAVQGGRFVNGLATAYSLVKDYGGWTEEDRQLLADLSLYITQDLNDIRDRSEMTPTQAAEGTSNWNMDMAIGSAMLGLVFDGMNGWEYGQQYFNNGYVTVLGQCMEMNIGGQDGAWNESIRYHNAAFSKIIVFAKAMRNMAEINWFAADAEIDMGESLFYNVLVATPLYQYDANTSYLGTPVYGDHVLSNGSEFSYVGLYYDEVARENPIRAYSMYKAWEKAGSPLPALSGDNNMLESFFAPLTFSESWLTAKGYTLQDAEEAYNAIGSTDTGSMGVDADLDGIVSAQDNEKVMDYGAEVEAAKTADKSNTYKSHGIMIFRNNFNVPGQECYLSMMANESYVAHNHKDQLSIQLFANNVPLILDPGIGGYWDLSKASYTLSSSHALTQFVNASGSAIDTLDASAVTPAAAQLDFYASENYDFMSAQTWKSANHTDGTLTRSIGYIKNGFEAYVIWDQADGADADTRVQYNLPLYAKETPKFDYASQRLTMKGFGNVNLDVLFLEGELPEGNVTIDTIKLPTNYLVAKREPSDSAATVDLFHAKSADANDDFLTVLFPSTEGANQTLESTEISTGIEGVKAYKLSYSENGKESVAYVITNASNQKATVNLGVTEKLVNLHDAALTELDATSIRVEAQEMLVLQTTEELNDDDTDDGNDDTDDGNQSSTGNSVGSNVASVEDWNAVASTLLSQDKIALKKGEDNGSQNVDILVGRNVVVPANIFESLEDSSLTLAMHVGNQVTLSISSENIPQSMKNQSMNLSLEDSRVETNAVRQVTEGTITSREVSFVNRGSFGMTVNMHFGLGTENAGNFANMYRYSEQSKSFIYVSSFRITAEGQAMFGIKFGGDYVITVTEENPRGSNIGYYVVQSGDTLSKIAAKNNRRMLHLITLNPEIFDTNLIFPEQRIRLY